MHTMAGFRLLRNLLLSMVAIGKFIVVTARFTFVSHEAAHENNKKDTDNFLCHGRRRTINT
jgi:hypothetical protein